MIRITYISQESAPLSADDLPALLTTCHANNTSRGVTGMLLFGNGTFLQVIEGETAVVDDLMARISRDARHKGVKVLRRDEIAQRQYSDWSMGFERVTEHTFAALPSLRSFGLRSFSPEILGWNDY
jgi:hypothetical protein